MQQIPPIRHPHFGIGQSQWFSCWVVGNSCPVVLRPRCLFIWGGLATSKSIENLLDLLVLRGGRGVIELWKLSILCPCISHSCQITLSTQTLSQGWFSCPTKTQPNASVEVSNNESCYFPNEFLTSARSGQTCEWIFGRYSHRRQQQQQQQQQQQLLRPLPGLRGSGCCKSLSSHQHTASASEIQLYFIHRVCFFVCRRVHDFFQQYGCWYVAAGSPQDWKKRIVWFRATSSWEGYWHNCTDITYHMDLYIISHYKES